MSKDGLKNVISGLGTAKSKLSGNRWHYDVLTDYATLDAAYQSWLPKHIVNIPAEDATRDWRRIKSEGAEDIEQEEQRLQVPCVIQQALKWARLYGGGGILMLTGQDLSKPLNVNRVGKGDLERLIVFDRWDMGGTTINQYDILAPNYLQPEFYTIRTGSQQIHWSHFARVEGETLPLRQMSQVQGWGDSALRSVLSDVEMFVGSYTGIGELFQEVNVDVIKREGLTDELSTDQDEAIVKRYELFSQMKSVFQMALLDGEETLERMTLQMGGVAAVLETFMTFISGASRMPVTKIFGTSAVGLNSTGEGDAKNYHDLVRSVQTSTLAPSLRTLDEVLVRSALGYFPDSFDYVWNPLYQTNEVEEAQARQLQAQTDMMYLEQGIIMKSQIQRNLQSNEQYQYEDEKIGELEQIEEQNMFAEAPVESDEEFMARFNELDQQGLSDKEIEEQL